jgi:hypothetical protein
MENSKDKIDTLYEILHDLEDRLGGKRELGNCTGKMNWPHRGVYFFFENGETRSRKKELRVARVGTHALKFKSKSTLWGRLRQHRGHTDFTGNHRGSIFRRHIGTAIIKKEHMEKDFPQWGIGQSAPRKVRDQEAPMEIKVSHYIGKMPFLWLAVEDPAGPQSQRGYFEKNSIALLSNFGKLGSNLAVDPPSANWLGFYCSNQNVRSSGLWNHNHVRESRVDPDFLNQLEKAVKRT